MNISNSVNPVEQELHNSYNTPVEMAEALRQSQVANIGLFAALAMLALTLYVYFKKPEQTQLQQITMATFILVEAFFLAVLRFLL